MAEDSPDTIERRFGTQLKRTLRLLHHHDTLLPRSSAAAPAASSTSSLDPHTELPKAWALLTQARAGLAAEFVRRLTTQPEPPKGLGNKLWLLFYKEVEPLQTKLAAQEARDKALWKKRLEAVMMEGAQCLTDALQQLRAAAKDNQEDAVSLMVALGDLARYAGRLVDADGDAAKTVHCLEQAESWYTQALGMRPGFGRAYNQLAIIATLKTKRVEDRHVVLAAVDYSRAFLAHGEPFAARDNLVALLDRWRRKHDLAMSKEAQAKSLEKYKASQTGGAVGSRRAGASSSSVKCQRDGVQQSLLKALHMLYARVDLDNVPHQARTLSRQLATLAQSIQRTGGVLDPSVLVGLKTLCLQAVVLSFGAFYDRAEAAGLLNKEEEEMEEKEMKLGPDLRGALTLAMEVGLVMASEGEVVGGWDDSRGPALLLVLSWLRTNQRWLRDLPGDRTADVVRAAQRRLVGEGKGGGLNATAAAPSPQVSTKELQQAALSEGERLVVGLRGFNLPSKRAYMLARRHLSEEGVTLARQKAMDISRCRIFMEAWEKEAGFEEKRKRKKEQQQQQQQQVVLSSSSSLVAEMATLAVTPPAPPLPPPPSVVASSSSLPSEVVCPSCSNVMEAEMMVGGGDVCCEFCGYQFEEKEKEEGEEGGWVEGSPIRNPLPLPTDPPPPASKPRGGMLSGVDLSLSLPSSSTFLPTTPSSSSSIKRLAAAPQPGLDTQQDGQSRLIVIDAANVAMRHGMKKYFSCQGIALALDYFRVSTPFILPPTHSPKLLCL